ARFALPIERDLVAVAGAYVAVETVLAHVQRAANEPLRERPVPLEDGAPFLGPVERERLLRPESLPVAFGFVVDVGAGCERVLRELLRRRERATFLQERFKCLGHSHCSFATPSVAPLHP